MGKSIKRIKRNMQPGSKVNVEALKQLAFEHGFNEGAKKQREMDIRFLAKILVDLEECPGIGEKTADKVQNFILGKFGYSEITKL